MVPDEFALAVQRSIGLGKGVSFLIHGTQIGNLVGHFAPCHLAIGSFDEAELVHPGVGAQRDDQTDIGTFRGFNGTYAPVMSWMDVTHLEAGPLSRKASGAEGA